MHWVSSKTGCDDFQHSAHELTKCITQKLKMDPQLLRERATEPGFDEATQYVQGTSVCSSIMLE